VYGQLIASQGAFDLEVGATIRSDAVAFLTARPRPLVPSLTAEGLAAHAAMVATIPNAIWLLRGYGEQKNEAKRGA
jgi:hypothetical protein